jgi:hypothetical protein
MPYGIYEDNPMDWFNGVATLYSLQTIQHCHYIKSMPYPTTKNILGTNFPKIYFFDDFFLFILGYLVEFFGNFWDTWPS